MITPSISCAEALAAIHLAVGDDLDGPERDRVQAHLAACASCEGSALRASSARGELIEGLRAASAWTSSAESRWPEIRAELAAQGLLSAGPDSGDSASPVVLRSTSWMRGLATAAAVLLLALLLRSSLDGSSSGMEGDGLALPSPPTVAGGENLSPTGGPNALVGAVLTPVGLDDERLLDLLNPSGEGAGVPNALVGFR